MVKDSKKEFKSVDKISKELDAVDNIVLKHWKNYVYLAIILVVIIALSLIFIDYNKKAKLKQSVEIQTASTVEALQAVINKYPNNDSTDFARLDLASKLYEEEKYDDAMKIYKEDAELYNTVFAKSIAKLNEAYLLEAEGKIEEAADKMETIANSKELPLPIRGEAYYSAGRMFYKLGDNDKAVECLENCIAEKDDKMQWPILAESLLNRI